MARQARSKSLDPDQVQVVHVVQRCVRRAFLCGFDRLTGQNYGHRRRWVRDRLEHLAAGFAIDCLTYSVLSNHLHLALRSRPDIVRLWSDEEVARRWLHICPVRRGKKGSRAKPRRSDIAAIVNDPRRVAELRRRLSDISWWMKCTSEHIARRANREDAIPGRFWEGRFKAQLLLDEASLLACAAYIDLNPVRAALAETLEQSDFTGAQDRLDDLRRRAERLAPESTPAWERTAAGPRSGWMSPLEIDERTDPTGPDPSSSGRRASDKGILPVPLETYLQLLDWTGRQLRADKRGAIPEHLAPILDRLGLSPDNWCELVARFGKIFKRAAGTPESLAAEAARRGQKSMHAPGLRKLFRPSAR